MGCTAETLRKWVLQAERDQGRRAGVTSTERERLKDLERENRELKRANEILRKASARVEVASQRPRARRARASAAQPAPQRRPDPSQRQGHAIPVHPLHGALGRSWR